jgi:TRAP-type C4-dicarboxylate transport system permease small subunit
MVVFLAIVLVSGGSLMHVRMAEGLSFDDTAGTPVFVAHACGAVLFLLCALAHVWINRERLEKLLDCTGEND